METNSIDRIEAIREKAAVTEQSRYSMSFVAKLSLADEEIRQYYTEISNRLLSFDKMHARVSWNYVNFSVSRNQVARFVVRGKTLCIYLAIQPEELTGRFRGKDATDIAKYAKTPTMLKLKSSGAMRYAMKLIDDIAQSMGLTENKNPRKEALLTTFPSDTFQNLLEQGLIRASKPIPNKLDTLCPTEEVQPEEETPDNNVYDDTVHTVNDLIGRYGIYAEIADALAGGNAVAKLSRRMMLRSIDEIWVNAVEDCLAAMDELIRNPSRFIVEKEDVMPIELTKKINNRSIQHLSQHTSYISSVTDDNVMPSKILNVFREDSLLTYENKFLNTLINRVYLFVHSRYELGLKQGVDEQITELTFEDTFLHGEIRANVKWSVELCEKVESKPDVKNDTLSTPLWKRVERLEKIVTSYRRSEFVKSMGKAQIKPPVMRTNAIRKNKYLRQCLALWEFIESYDDSGYGLTINEQLENLSDEYIRQIYSGAAMQYLLFRHNVRGDYDVDKILATAVTQQFNPRIIDEIPEVEEEDFDIHEEKKEEAEEQDILFALDVALKADAIYMETHSGRAEILADSMRRNRIDRSFMARLILSDDTVKRYYVEICQAFAACQKVKNRISWHCSTFYVGRETLAKVVIRGKTLYLYLALDPAKQDAKYFIKDQSDSKKYEQTPSLFKVRSERALKYAKELINELALKYELAPADPPAEVQTEYPTETEEALIARGLIRVSEDYVPGGQSPDEEEEAEEAVSAETSEEAVAEAPAEATPAEEIAAPAATMPDIDRSFMARLIMAEDDVKRYYVEVCREFAKYDRVKNRVSWQFSSFHAGRDILAKLAVKGKSLYLYLALNPAEQDAKYFIKDQSASKKYEQTPSLFKIKSERALKYAKELIALVAAQYELTEAATPAEVQTEYPTETEEALIARGLIRVGQAKVVPLAAPAEPVVQPAAAAETERAVLADSSNPVQNPYSYDRSFMSRLIMAENDVKRYYVEVCREFAKYDRVKNRVSWQYSTFNAGRDTLAKLAVKGKSLYLYLALDPASLDAKYFIKDQSDSKKYEQTPALFKIKGERALKYAKELIALLAGVYELTEAATPAEVKTDYPTETEEALIARGLIRVTENKLAPAPEPVPEPISAPVPEPMPEPAPEPAPVDEANPVGSEYNLDRSFMARLILAEDDVKRYYVEVCREFAKYDRAKNRVSWQFSSFNAGREPLAKLAVKGKSLYLYLALDPASLDAKYFIKDQSASKKYEQTPALFKIKSERALKYAKELVNLLAGVYELTETETPAEVQTEYPTETEEALIARGLIRVTENAVPAEQTPAEQAPVAQRAPAPRNMPEEEYLKTVPLEDKPSEDSAEIPFKYHTDDREIIMPGEETDLNTSDYMKRAERDAGSSRSGIGSLLVNPPRDDEDENEKKKKRDTAHGNTNNASQSGEAKDIQDDARREHMSESDLEEDYVEEDTLDVTKFHRPQNMDYSRPTKVGVDDVSGFIADDEETGHKAPEKKKGLLSRFLKR